MKNRLFRALLALIALLPLAGRAQVDHTTTLTFTKGCGATKEGSVYKATATQDGFNWTIQSDAAESTYDPTKGIHFGTGNAAVSYISLTTADIKGTIKQVVVNCSGATGVTGTVDVTVGGTAFGGSAQNFSKTATDYTFTGSATGTVVATVKKPSSAKKAIYVKSVSVTYETSSQTMISVSVTFPQRSYQAVLGSPFTSPTATVSPAGLALTYSSSKASVATVDAATGTVTLAGAGTATITASYAGDATHYAAAASYTLTVKSSSTVAPDAPVITPATGTYTAQQSVSISAATGATIYYTTDGTEPTTSSARYSSPFTLTSSATIRAIAVGANGLASPVATSAVKIVSTAWTATTTSSPSGYDSYSYNNVRYYRVVWDHSITSDMPLSVIDPDDSGRGKMWDWTDQDTSIVYTDYVGVSSTYSNTVYAAVGYNSSNYSDVDPTVLTDNNIRQFFNIRAVKKDGVVWEPVVHVMDNSYRSSSRYYKDIAVTYVHNPAGSPLQYSRTYYPSGSAYEDAEYVTLPEGEMAVSLYMDGVHEVTDTLTRPDVRYYYYNNSFVDSVKYSAPQDDEDFYGAVTYTTDGKYSSSWTTPRSTGTVGSYSYDEYNTKSLRYYRKHSVPYSTAVSVTIPREATIDGTTYKVTKLDYAGFGSKLQTITLPRKYCDSGKTESSGKRTFWASSSPHNRVLRSVSFELPSNVNAIEPYAFAGCENLRGIEIPVSVDTIGSHAFFCDYLLASVRFQTKQRSDGETGCSEKLTYIDDYTFYGCTGLTSLEIPFGIDSVGDYALTYNFALRSIVIPNSMQKLGAHFLCCAQNLVELTVPASVTYINGAFLHGCESLKDVYLLGPASALQASAESGQNTFGYNSYYCMNHVTGCTFHVTSDYYDGYATDKVWSLVDEQGLSDGSTHSVNYSDGTTGTITDTYANILTQIQPEVRTFEADKWQTVIFPSRKQLSGDADVYGSDADFTDTNGRIKYVPLSYFGDDAIVSRMTGVSIDDQNPSLFHLEFTIIRGKLDDDTYGGDDWDKIPVNDVLMIKPGKTAQWTMFTDADQQEEEFKMAATDDHNVSVTATDGSMVTMKGRFLPYQTTPWDFFFISNPQNYHFVKVVTADKAPKVGATRCWWRLDVGGYKTEPNAGKAMVMAQPSPVIPTAIIDIKADAQAPHHAPRGIFDLSGRRVATSFERLQPGIYIVDGRKVVKR